MKAFSVRQPWAWAILNAGKDIENRSNRTNFRGTVFLHTGLQDYGRCGIDDMLEIASERRPDIGDEIDVPFFRDLPRGAIIGRVDVVDCVTSSDSPWFVGPFGWVLANPVAFPTPIPCPGMLGFFTPPEAVFHETFYE